jgi:hypothetical protein
MPHVSGLEFPPGRFQVVYNRPLAGFFAALDVQAAPSKSH